MSKAYTNSCGSDPLDPFCFCFAMGPSQQYKIYDVSTGSYVCCGNIAFNIVGSGGNAYRSAAVQDDPRCLGWWYGTAENFDTTGLTMPVPVTDFFFPDWAVTGSNMPSSFGPTSEELGNVSTQAGLRGYFTLPENAPYNTNGVQITCPDGQVVEWLHYANPNQGGAFASTMVCFDPTQTNSLKASGTYTNGNWATYKSVCGDQHTCNVAVGQLLAPPNQVGAVVLQTPGYTGNRVPVPESDESWLLWFVLILFIIVIVVCVIVVVWLTNRKPNENKIVQ